jgi:hypothetical protein
MLALVKSRASFALTYSRAARQVSLAHVAAAGDDEQPSTTSDNLRKTARAPAKK